MGRYAKDLTGQVFGRLTVMERTGELRNERAVWHCFCVCGSKHSATSDALQRGNVRSCGCLGRETKLRALKARAAPCPFSPARLEQLYKDGTNIAEIAEFAGVQRSVAKRWLIESGIGLRDHSAWARIWARKNRAYMLLLQAKASQVSALQVLSGERTVSHIHTPKVIRARVRTFLKNRATIRDKQQAEREQTEAIERALNGETF